MRNAVPAGITISLTAFIEALVNSSVLFKARLPALWLSGALLPFNREPADWQFFGHLSASGDDASIFVRRCQGRGNIWLMGWDT